MNDKATQLLEELGERLQHLTTKTIADLERVDDETADRLLTQMETSVARGRQAMDQGMQTAAQIIAYCRTAEPVFSQMEAALKEARAKRFPRLVN